MFHVEQFAWNILKTLPYPLRREAREKCFLSAPQKNLAENFFGKIFKKLHHQSTPAPTCAVGKGKESHGFLMPVTASDRQRAPSPKGGVAWFCDARAGEAPASDPANFPCKRISENFFAMKFLPRLSREFLRSIFIKKGNSVIYLSEPFLSLFCQFC